MKNIINDDGFSLMEIMIAVGLTSVLFLGITSGLKMMAKGQATSETKMEELEIRRQIMSLLADKLACQNTFATFKIGDPITDIKTTSNTVAFKVGNNYGNNSLKITALVTRDTGQVLSNGAKSVDLVVSFQKMKKIVSQTSVNTTVSLSVITKAGGIIETCFSDTEAIISSATNQSCTSLGGIWNGTKCTLPACEPGQVLQGISDTGAICKTLICNDGEILKGIDSGGNILCVPNIPTYQ